MGKKQKTKSEVLTDFLTFGVFDSFLKKFAKLRFNPFHLRIRKVLPIPRLTSWRLTTTKKMVLPGHIDPEKQRFPYCIVWTPIPFLTWLFPFIGHMGIATSAGVIRDFAGPYYVGEGAMAFGKPTRYLQMDPSLAAGGA